MILQELLMLLNSDASSSRESLRRAIFLRVIVPVLPAAV